MREYYEYKAFYCGLCKTLNACYGLKSKFLLNYDCTFAAILITALTEDSEELCYKGRCSFKPIGRKIAIAKRNNALEYAAALNVILAYNKLADDKLDERKMTATVGMSLYRSAKRKVDEKYPFMSKLISEGTGALHEIEKARCADIDKVSALSGDMLSALIVPAVGDRRDLPAISNLLRALGRWIYLVDAWDDREKDNKKGLYNVFNITEASEERAGVVMRCLLDEIITASDLLEYSDNSLPPIIDNILGQGLYYTTMNVLSGKGRNGNRGNKTSDNIIIEENT